MDCANLFDREREDVSTSRQDEAVSTHKVPRRHLALPHIVRARANLVFW